MAIMGMSHEDDDGDTKEVYEILIVAGKDDNNDNDPGDASNAPSVGTFP